MLAPNTAYEVDVALALRPSLTPTDLGRCERGFPSYRFFATLCAANIQVVGRCSRASFRDARPLFADDAPVSRVVSLRPPPAQKAALRALGLPRELRIRFVRVVLDTGEVEVLATSLCDDATFPAALFKERYACRWGVETFYDRVKNRLNLEHFSGTTVEAVKQDFYATLFISGLESILIQDAQRHLDHTTAANQYPQQVNHTVAFNTIKNQVIDLLLSEQDPVTLYQKLTQLFLTTPVLIRKGRHGDRVPRTATPVVHYYKRIKKICF